LGYIPAYWNFRKVCNHAVNKSVDLTVGTHFSIEIG